MPKVTIYITNYNYGEYLKEAIVSVLGQTYKDYELIIIDDGSTDNSREILSEYEGLDGIFVVFQKNKGLNASNNIALKLSRGDYIVRLDSDDYFDPRAIEIMVSTLDNDERLALVFPDYYTISKEGDILESIRRHNFNEQVSMYDQPAHGACTMIRTSVLKKIGGYDETFNRQDGYNLWLNVINNYMVSNINLPLFYYRQHEKSITANEELLLDTRKAMKTKFAKDNNLQDPNVLCVIPVRGSEIDPRSLPLTALGNKTLVQWTIDEALKCELLNSVIVTTPDEHLIQFIYQEYGDTLVIHKRDVSRARINQPIEKTIGDILENYRKDHPLPDAILILYIEAPFRSAKYMEKAIRTMQIYNADVVDGVRLDDSIFYFHDGNGLKPRWKDGGLRLERNDTYRRVGGIHLINTKYFLKNKKMIGGRIGHIEMDERAAFYIKSALDLEIVQFLASGAF